MTNDPTPSPGGPTAEPKKAHWDLDGAEREAFAVKLFRASEATFLSNPNDDRSADLADLLHRAGCVVRHSVPVPVDRSAEGEGPEWVVGVDVADGIETQVTVRRDPDGTMTIEKVERFPAPVSRPEPETTDRKPGHLLDLMARRKASRPESEASTVRSRVGCTVTVGQQCDPACATAPYCVAALPRVEPDTEVIAHVVIEGDEVKYMGPEAWLAKYLPGIVLTRERVQQMFDHCNDAPTLEFKALCRDWLAFVSPLPRAEGAAKPPTCEACKRFILDDLEGSLSEPMQEWFEQHGKLPDCDHVPPPVPVEPKGWLTMTAEEGAELRQHGQPHAFRAPEWSSDVRGALEEIDALRGALQEAEREHCRILCVAAGLLPDQWTTMVKERDALLEAVVKVRAHTGHTKAQPDQLHIGLLASIERIADAALASLRGDRGT